MTFSLRYDTGAQLTNLDVNLKGEKVCSYQIVNLKVTSVYPQMAICSRPGTHVDSALRFSFIRFRDCCKEKMCEEEMKAWIKGHKSADKSIGTTSGTPANN